MPVSTAEGVKLAVLTLTVTVPAIAPPAAVGVGVGARVKLAAVSVEFVIASEKVAEIAELGATPVAALAGKVESTVGGVVSCAAPVVKAHV